VCMCVYRVSREPDLFLIDVIIGTAAGSHMTLWEFISQPITRGVTGTFITWEHRCVCVCVCVCVRHSTGKERERRKITGKKGWKQEGRFYRWTQPRTDKLRNNTRSHTGFTSVH